MITVALFFGGRSNEHEVSIMSCKNVYKALDTDKYSVEPVFITKEGKWRYVDGAVDDSFDEEKTVKEGAPVTLAVGADRPALLIRSDNGWKEHPVDVALPVLHGIGGDENSMVNGMGVQELLAGLIGSGQAEEMIIVLPSQFTSKNGAAGGFGIDQATCEAYDNFLYDISDSLIDFIEDNYSVKPGRENRAITGFSMGGREAIYCGLMRPDLFGYVGGACPAPGITPAQDMFMTHPGCMTESEMKFRDVGPEPYVFMITGGTNDSVVGDFPKQYSNTLTKNGVEHVYQSIPGGGHGADSVKPHLYTFMRYAFKGGSSEPAVQPTTTTTTTTTTSTTTTTTTTTAPIITTTQNDNGGSVKEATVWGDANCDGKVNLGDAVLIMQSISNPSAFQLTDQGKVNADVYQNGSGITTQDATSIQKFLLQSITKLPESYL